MSVFTGGPYVRLAIMLNTLSSLNIEIIIIIIIIIIISCFGVRVSVMFHFMFVHYTFSSVWVAEWPPFGK